MSRVALLVLTLVAAGLFAAQVRSAGDAAIAAAHRSLDRQLEKADRDALAASEALGRESLAAAEAVAHSEALQAALGERVARGELPDAAALDAASGALAARPPGEGRSTLLVLVTDRGFAESRLGEAPRSGEGPRVTPAALALTGKPAAGLAVVDERLYRVAAVPVGAGQKPLGAVVLGFPVDDAYAGKLAQASGTEVSVVRGDKAVASTLPPAERAQVGPESARSGMLPFGFGAVPADAARIFGLRLPWLLRGAASQRATAQPVPGVEEARLVLSVDEIPHLGLALELEREGILSGLAVLLLGLVLLPLARPPRARAAAPGHTPAHEPQLASGPLLPPEPAFGPPEPVPEGAFEAVSTDPFGRGQARPPVEKTLVAPAASGEKPPLSPTQPRPMDAGWPAAFDGLPEPPTVIASPLDPFAGLPAPPPRPPLEPTRVAEPTVQAAPQDPFSRSFAGGDPPTVIGVAAEETRVTTVPEALIRATSRPVDADPETIHFQEVFREFLEVRRHCGEPVDGITFDRFAAKLRKNRDQLLEKYRCRAVRFTVYVKDGKTALKATPVRE